MRLTEDVHVVGGGDFAFNISHRLDCHVYLIKGEKDLALVDSGFDEPEQVVKNIQEDGFDPANISRIFITHYHADHTGGLARLRRMLGATVVAGAEAAPTIRAGDADQIGLTWAQGFGFFPPEYRWEASEVDVEMTDADRFDIGGLEMTAIATPGHCQGHYCLLLHGRDRTYLFAGDHVFWGGAIILQNVRDSSVQQYAASMTRCLEYNFEALLPGHLTISLRNGKRHVETADRDFRRIGLPKSLLG